MRILIISWFFPPSSTMGAMRVGKLARFLIEQGHELRVVTPGDPPHPQTLAIDYPPEVVRPTPWTDINRFEDAVARRLKGRRKRPAGQVAGATVDQAAGAGPRAGGAAASGPSGLARLYRNLVNFPDSRIGWLPHALAEGRRCLGDWPADIIFASGPPFTTLVAGHRLSKRSGIPWIIEFRDRWVDDAYTPLDGWQLAIGGRLERRMVTGATRLVTVSEPWAADYRAKYPTPTAVVYNGYDPRDYGDDPCLGATDAKGLRIVYTGGIYAGRRDPSPLFEAIGGMGAAGRAIGVEFYGTKEHLVRPLADKFGVADRITVHPRVTLAQSIKAQQHADILLLMQWDNPAEQGNVPGKLFEYLGARRPILGLGLDRGVPATIIAERGAGVYLNDPGAIARQLNEWLDIKHRQGGIPALPESCRAGFTRDDQYRKLEKLFKDSLAGGA